MRLSSVLLSFAVTRAICSPTTSATDFTAEKCAELEVMARDQAKPLEGTDLSALRKCQIHPSKLGIVSSLYNQNEASLTSPAKRRELDDEVITLTKRYTCTSGGRGHGLDYDYGCDGGWCWRNCGGPFSVPFDRPKPWCWLKYEGGKGGWTPCGRWQDCEYSYNNKNSKCAKGNCESCGCGC